MMDKKQQAVYEQLTELGSETLVNTFLNYFGLQMLDNNFIEYLKREELIY